MADPEAWLFTITTRCSIDRLRRVRAAREQYVGVWLPEPILTDSPATPDELLETSSDLSVAFLTVLERLAPESRAAYLLRELFDADYGDIARLLEKSEVACRQIVHRAKSQLRDERPRYVVSAEEHQRLMRRFAEACANFDLEAMKTLMAESATLVSDGGGVVPSVPRPMVGGARVAQLLFASTLRRKHEMRLEIATINGRFGVLRYFGDELESAQSYVTDGKVITHVHVQRNPEKLRRVVLRSTARLQ